MWHARHLSKPQLKADPPLYRALTSPPLARLNEGVFKGVYNWRSIPPTVHSFVFIYIYRMEELIYYCLSWLVNLNNEKWALLEPSIKTLKKEKPTGRKDWIISKILNFMGKRRRCKGKSKFRLRIRHSKIWGTWGVTSKAW